MSYGRNGRPWVDGLFIRCRYTLDSFNRENDVYFLDTSLSLDSDATNKAKELNL